MRAYWRLAFFGAAVGLLVAGWIARGAVLPVAARWLDVGLPPGESAAVLVLPGDENVRPFVAAALVNAGLAERVLIPRTETGPDVEDEILPPNDAVIRGVLVTRGVPDEKIGVLDGASGSTFDDARALAGLLAESPQTRIAVVTSGYHTRRARWVFSRVLGERARRVSFVSAPTDRFGPEDWWQTEAGLKAIVGEYGKFAFYVVRYGEGGWLIAALAGAAVVLVVVRRVSGGDSRAARWWHVVRYHRPSQLALRMRAIARRRWLTLTGGGRYARLPATVPRTRGERGFRPLLEFKLAARREAGAAEKARRVLGGQFRFLNQERNLGRPIDWRASGAGASHLWRFHLHYHEFLLDLAAEAADRSDASLVQAAWEIAGDWIEANRPGTPGALGDAWHPFCISRRLPVWALLWSAGRPAGALAERVLASVHLQATFLEDHLERDLGGNHLLENARALVIAGAFLEGPDAERWLRTGSGLLHRELPRQILPHGEHFERSPMYHAAMLELVLDVRDVCVEVDPGLSALCEETARRMAGFLDQIVHPDGAIPLFGDSCLGETAPVAMLVERAGGTRGAGAEGAAVVGDYWVWSDGGDRLIFDAGAVGPDHLPAHAHSDLLTFEASVGGRRVFVDAGVCDYGDGEMRRHCRSTAAHNVLEVDGREQCDTWSRFRMGHRGWPSPLETGAAHGFCWARASHDAYRRLGVPRVGRWIACRRGGPWVCVDWVVGSGRRRLVNRLHVHPAARVELVGDRECAIVLEGLALRWRSLTEGRLSVVDGWYCPEFGLRQRCPVIEWEGTGRLPAACGWSLVWGDACDRETFATETGARGISLICRSSADGAERVFDIAL